MENKKGRWGEKKRMGGEREKERERKIEREREINKKQRMRKKKKMRGQTHHPFFPKNSIMRRLFLKYKGFGTGRPARRRRTRFLISFSAQTFTIFKLTTWVWRGNNWTKKKKKRRGEEFHWRKERR